MVSFFSGDNSLKLKSIILVRPFTSSNFSLSFILLEFALIFSVVKLYLGQMILLLFLSNLSLNLKFITMFDLGIILFLLI